MKQLIVISHDRFVPNEAILIERIIEAGADRIHLRKPQASDCDIEKLLQEISPQYYRHIVLHDAHKLAPRYNVGGIHLNNRNPIIPNGWKGDVSRSCHKLEEIEYNKSSYSYTLLSPIFDSISKEGYKANFSPQNLIRARNSGIIDDSVIALGGITCDNATEALDYGFGGVAVLGHVWCNNNADNIEHIVTQLKKRLICYNL